jgi:hypothetical protein
MQLLASPHTSLHANASQQHKSLACVWGVPSHPEVPRSSIPLWCADIVGRQEYARFRELLGHFIILVDEPCRRRTTFITDILGVRPMFVGRRDSRLIFGSNVWPLQQAGWITGTVDYDAMAAWIAYGYNCTEGSLFSELQRLPPGAAIVFQDGQCTVIPYAQFAPKAEARSPDEVAEDLHAIVASTLISLLADHPRVSLALSGGYDSRYLLALSVSMGKAAIDCGTVCYAAEGGGIAQEVARALGLRLRKFEIKGSIQDFYDQLYYFMADGFPISKSVPYRIAQQYPELPMLNGYLGDSLMRGSHDKYRGEYETAFGDNLADILQRRRLAVTFKIFRRKTAEQIKARSRLPMEKAVREGSRIGKIFGWTDLYHRQRFYISVNFLQHLALTEALLPFYSWALLRYKMEHDYRLFGWGSYERIFQKYFPSLAQIPHASELLPDHHKSAKSARRWACELFVKMWDKRQLSLLSKLRCLPVSGAGIIAAQRWEWAILTFERLYLLEQKMRQAGVAFDWEDL